MTRFADPAATRLVEIPGGCQCPGTPHEKDEAVFRYQIGASALARIGRAELQGAVALDPMAAYRQTVLETVESWNLVWLDPGSRNGSRRSVPVPITPTNVAEMDVDTLKFLAETADGLIANEGSLPNESGAPSAASSRESASPHRKRSRKPTTSSSP